MSSSRDTAGTPNVSVIVPTWNRSGYLERCLLSLKAQDLASPFEIVVVDDGSHDDTEALVTRISADGGGPPVRYTRQSHRGLVRARLLGISVAEGDLLVFIDDDAEAPRHWLSELVRWAQLDGVGMVGGPVYPLPTNRVAARIGEDGSLDWATFHCRPSDSFTDVDFVPGGNMAIWRDALEAAGSFDPGFDGDAWREETDLCVRVKQVGLRIGFVRDSPIEHAGAKWKPGLRVRPVAQFLLGKNNGYFVGKHFRTSKATFRSLVTQPIQELLQVGLDLCGGCGALALWPVRWVGTAYGLALGRRVNRESSRLDADGWDRTDRAGDPLPGGPVLR